MPSPSTWFTVPSERCTASIMGAKRGRGVAGRLRVEVLNQLGRVLDIGKQHRHLFAFAFQGTAGGEDLLGEIRWGIGQRTPSCPERMRRRDSGCGGVTGPDQHRACLVPGELVLLSTIPSLDIPAGVVQRNCTLSAGHETRPRRRTISSTCSGPRLRLCPPLHSADSCLGSLTVHHTRTRECGSIRNGGGGEG